MVEPDYSIRQRLENISAERSREASVSGLGGDGGGPHDPDMDRRVANLEAGMETVKGSLARIETLVGRLAGRHESLATKADVATLTERVSGQNDRLKNVDTAISETIKSAIGKSIGPWQLPGLLAACVAIAVAFYTALNWVVHQPWFVR